VLKNTQKSKDWHKQFILSYSQSDHNKNHGNKLLLRPNFFYTLQSAEFITIWRDDDQSPSNLNALPQIIIRVLINND